MPVKMAPHQLAFWRELLSPFPEGLLSTKPGRGGKELTWLDKRAIENRLDSVCGPDGWYAEYEQVGDGLKCSLSIRCPMPTEGVWVFVTKADGAGKEGMQTADDDEKSGYTNAFRRAAQDAWGIGRYLYLKGIPTFLDPNARPIEEAGFVDSPSVASQKHADAHDSMASRSSAPKAAPAPTSSRYAEAASSSSRGTTSESPSTSASGSSTSDSRPATPEPTRLELPKSGKAVFPWVSEMEKLFDMRLMRGMATDGETKGIGSKFVGWSPEDVAEISLNAVRHIRECPTYKGQFEHLFTGATASPVQPYEPTQTPTNTGVNISDLRKSLSAKIDALIAKQTGGTPTNEQKKSAFEQIAAASPNHAGNKGEVPENLRGMTDVAWLKNMVALTDKQIAESGELPPDDDIPF